MCEYVGAVLRMHRWAVSSVVAATSIIYISLDRRMQSSAPISAGCGTKAASLVAAGKAERPLPIAANRLDTVIGGLYDDTPGARRGCASPGRARRRPARRPDDEVVLVHASRPRRRRHTARAYTPRPAARRHTRSSEETHPTRHHRAHWRAMRPDEAARASRSYVHSTVIL